MSRTLSAPGRGSRTALAGAFALALAALSVLGLTSQANAAFTTTQCAGADVLGRGASFANAAHGAWETSFKNVFCGGSAPDISYDPAGSGDGINGMKLRGGADPRFGGTDDPLTATQKAEINKGTAAEGDEGQVHQIPIAVGAVAALVNFPDGCNPDELEASAQTAEQNLDGDGVQDDVIRVKFTKDQFEKIWAQGATEGGPAPMVSWHEIFTDLAGTAACEKPIIRVVRFDKSGTTFAFKDYLDRINPARKWLTSFSGSDNRLWPGAELGSSGQCVAETAPGKKADNEDHLTSGCSKGAGNLVSTLNTTDGSIGYADVATARSGNLTITPEANDNDKFWVPLPNGAGQVKEPTLNEVKGFRSDATTNDRGANCTETEFENVPATTLGEWEDTTGVDSDKGYGLCTLTYGLVFDDNADPYGALPAATEEARARTVKDYFTFIITEGQSLLFQNDYTPLPTGIRNIAKAGIEAVDWQKGEGGGGKEENEDGGKKDGGSTPPPPPSKPSNEFSLLRKSISSKTGGATLAVKLPGAGKLELIATAKNGKNTINVARAVLNAGQQGTFNVPLRPSGAAMKALRKKGSLPVKVALTFTPTGGDANESTSTLVLKLKKPAKRK